MAFTHLLKGNWNDRYTLLSIFSVSFDCLVTVFFFFSSRLIDILYLKSWLMAVYVYTAYIILKSETMKRWKEISLETS